MKPADLLKHFSQADIDETVELNPLAVAESRFFHQRQMPLDSDKRTYRDKAIDCVIKKKLPYASTYNSVYDLAKRFIKVACSYCGGETDCVFAGGSGGSFTLDYRCTKCAAKHTLTLTHDAIHSEPKESVGSKDKF